MNASCAEALLTAASCTQAQWEGLIAELDARVVNDGTSAGVVDSAKTDELIRVEEALRAVLNDMNSDKYLLAAWQCLEETTALINNFREKLKRARSTLHLLRAYKAQHFPDGSAVAGARAEE